MTRDDAKKMLGEGATEEQISNLLNSFHNSLKEKEEENRQLKIQLEKQSDYSDLKSAVDTYKKEKMTAEELIASKTKEANDKLSAANKILNTAKAKTILSGYGLTDEAIEKLVSDDETTTIATANLFKAQMDSYKDNITKSVKEEIASLDIKPNPTNISQEDTGMTREKFSKMTMLEQKNWKNANLDQYHEMFPKE